MTLVLIKEGDRYRPEVEMDPKDMPQRLLAEDFDTAEIPKAVNIWGAMINPEAATALQRFIDETDDDGNPK